jgi:DNA-binding transcriptional MerR regulator
VQALRRTGMPVADVREFVQLGGGTLDVHPIRLRLLEQQAAAIEAQLAQLHEDLAVVQAKTAEYRRLIALGLDCEDEGASDAVA